LYDYLKDGNLQHIIDRAIGWWFLQANVVIVKAASFLPYTVNSDKKVIHMYESLAQD
jgi:hypothetical protein